MPKASSSLYAQRRTCTVAAILLLGKIMLSLCSRCAKEGLVCVALASPLFRQPSSYLKCTRANIRLSYDVRSSTNAKCVCPMTFNSL